jgi:hypothetical protein
MSVVGKRTAGRRGPGAPVVSHRRGGVARIGPGGGAPAGATGTEVLLRVRIREKAQPMDTSMRATQSPVKSISANSYRVVRNPADKPRLAVRVGITGHRVLSPRDIGRIEEQIGIVLERISRITDEVYEQCGQPLLRIYSDAKPILRLISPLAEGADQLAAEQALRKGFEIQSPLPFNKEEYERDFQSTDNSSAEKISAFRRLLAKTNGNILELDGSRTAEGEAYEAVGRIVIRQCDVLIAVWAPDHNGGAEKKGGTRQIIRESLRAERPIIWISAESQTDPCLLLSIEPPRTEDLNSLDTILKAILLPHFDDRMFDVAASAKEIRELIAREEEIEPEDTFFSEQAPLDSFGIPKYGLVYSWFRDFWCWDLKEDPPEPEPDWSPILAKNPRFAEIFKGQYHWADNLANLYGGIYRSSYVATYLMGAFAVLFAFSGLYSGIKFPEGHPWHALHYAFYGAELLLILSISVITFRGIKRDWHRRWIDYRILAENFRQALFLAPLGRVNPSFNIPVYSQQSDPRDKLLDWYFRAKVREAGMAKGTLDKAHLTLYKMNLQQAIKGQITYHHNNTGRHELLSRRIRQASYGLFGLAGVSCVIHFTPEHWYPEGISLGLNLCTIVLPAFGAALGAIAHQGEFEKISMQSKDTKERLVKLSMKLNDAQETSEELGNIAEKFSEIMIGELLGWRFAFIHKSLEPV